MLNNPFPRILKALGYSLQGFKAAYATETAFRQELALCILLAPLAIILGHTASERALMLGSLLLVLITELINTAFEAVIERISPERHPLSGKVKDIGSAAVMLACINMLLIWIIVLIG